MQEKILLDELSDLPLEIQGEVAKHLSLPELQKRSEVSMSRFNLFKPIMDVRKLLHYVVDRKQDKVQAMLKNDINLIFKQGQVRDCSDRLFEKISGFEYVLWAFDKPMWAAMLNCLPHNEQGNKIRACLRAQYNELEQKGITYSLNGREFREKHFDFENTIIKELDTQVKSLNASGTQNMKAIGRQWREGVGGAQKLLPLHVIDDYYCSDVTKRIFYNLLTGKDEYWFNLESKLGIDFAIYTGSLGVPHCIKGDEPWWAIKARTYDLANIKKLYDARLKDFTQLKLQLEEPELSQLPHSAP